MTITISKVSPDIAFRYEVEGYLNSLGPSAGVSWGSITGTLSEQTELSAVLNSKQDDLVSGETIKTVNGSSLLGSGNISISGGASIKSATITIPSDKGGRIETRLTVSDAEVTDTSKITVMLGNMGYSDENEAELLDIVALSAIPQSGSFIVSANFGARVAGPIKINYMIGI